MTRQELKPSQVETTIMGIDPGSQNAGYAIIKTQDYQFQILDSGVCKLDSKTDFFQRLALLFTYFSELSQNLSSFELAIESLAYVKNVNSFGKLAQARGVIISALQPKAQKICEYPPNLVKSTVSGHGHASKQNIEKSLNFSVKGKEFRTHDESDALAVALCHHFQGGQVRVPSKKSGGNSLKSAFKGRGL